MILPLRQRHRRTVFALGFFLPVAFAVGIAARKPTAMVAELPMALVATSETFESVAWERADLFAKSPVQVRLLRERNKSGRFAVAFSAAKDFVQPDLIVYWVAGNPIFTDTLPDQAILLGAFNAPPLPLPDEIEKSSGAMILYSLANGEIVDVSKPIHFNDSTE
jgi:hypothetical protein